MFSRPLSRFLSSSAPVLSRSFAMNASSLNPRVLAAEYAVRGELVIKADELRTQLQKQPGSLPFPQIVACNIGNPQELGQTPITFPRQVLALLHYPELLKNPAMRAQFPADAVARAEKYLSASSGTGAYTASVGLRIIRDEIAEFIAERDGFPSDPDNVFVTDGASSAVKFVLNLLIASPSDGLLIPIPQYPLYTASLALYGGSPVKYYLDEANGWGMKVTELEASIADAKRRGINTRALVVINPGNPTGQCLPKDVMIDIVRFCEQNQLVLLADEVYQANIYSTTPFTSFKRVVAEMKSKCELVSFHSVSKGFLGECGQRGGYMELFNIDPAVKAQLVKLASISLCSNTSGQIMTGLMCRPPKPGQPSFAQYERERDTILASLKRRALQVAKTLNSLQGVTCNPVEGALYAFPQIRFPAKFIAEAQTQKRAADFLYCKLLLESTGICVVPGSGFGQQDGTWHFRTTILPSEKDMDGVMKRWTEFHKAFVAKYQ